MTPGAVMTTLYSEAQARQDIALAHAQHGMTIQAFHELVYRSPFTWGITRFEGVHVLKTPEDLWTYHEWIHLLKPELIIETGTAHGGSALYFARQLEQWGGRVVSVDVEAHTDRPAHPRVGYIDGNSIDPKILHYMKMLASKARTMVVLDSLHMREHVLAELDAYAPLVSPGQLLVVEDTNLDGPREALEMWLPLHQEFQREVLCERHLLTFFPGGWLRRVR